MSSVTTIRQDRRAWVIDTYADMSRLLIACEDLQVPEVSYYANRVDWWLSGGEAVREHKRMLTEWYRKYQGIDLKWTKESNDYHVWLEANIPSQPLETGLRLLRYDVACELVETDEVETVIERVKVSEPEYEEREVTRPVMERKCPPVLGD